ncbi:MAG: DEAD/DEAH box helicase [Alphaproteobacteria bacterium]|nr:DEAD/DEAH box helicase [Alphaproteobacteria bacterium]
MSKEILDFFNTDLQFIRGVGPVLAQKLENVIGGRKVVDFLLHKPSYVRPHEIYESVLEAPKYSYVTLLINIQSIKRGNTFHGKRRPTQIICKDKFANIITIQFFNTKFLDYWIDKLPVGQWRLVSGKLEQNTKGHFIINHPEFIETQENANKIPNYQTIYPSGEGLTQKVFTNIRNQIFNILHEKEQFISKQDDLTEFLDALEHIHFSKSNDDLLPNNKYISKLAYWELLAHQSAIYLNRRHSKEEKISRVIRQKKYDLLNKFYEQLPFSLTNDQQRVINEIFTDLNKNVPMMRLVQGDVGSGKTMVALATMIKMAETGAQSVLLVPTDTLAQQHFSKILPICTKMGLVCDILTGRDKGKTRKEKIISLKSGRTKIIIGTHALFSEDVIYKDLGLIVIDEQHRFGVAQRTAMRSKGNNPDMLALSATPIPRTLSMTVYGDMDISVIKEKPAGRLPIKTTKLPINRVNDLITRIASQIAHGAKVFWICPLVEDSETTDLTAVQTRFDELNKRFPGSGLCHGQMDKKSRDDVMSEFANPDSKM